MLRQSGFTLLETLAALVITVMLATFAVHGTQNLLQRGRDEALRMNLQQWLERARSEAEIRHQTISLCNSRDQHTCGGRWSEGQLMFIDTQRDGMVHDAEQIIAVNKMQPGRGNLYVRFYPVYRDAIQFVPLAQANDDNGTLWYCHAGQRQPAWAIKVSKMGGTQVLQPDRQGNIQDGSGHLLLCESVNSNQKAL